MQPSRVVVTNRHKLDCVHSVVFGYFSYKILCSVALPAEYFLHLALLGQSGHQEPVKWAGTDGAGEAVSAGLQSSAGMEEEGLVQAAPCCGHSGCPHSVR